MDYTKPIEIMEGIYWVGFYDSRASFTCNPYLIVDKNAAGELTEAVLIDPGPVSHFPIVARKIFNIIDFYKISCIVFQHQDPDICGALPLFHELIGREDLKIAAHKRAALLINYYTSKKLNYYYPEGHNYLFNFQSKKTLEFIPAHYLHTPGVINVFDKKNGVLFSSDIFGSFTPKWEFYADEKYPEKMREFHEFYMPSKEIVRKYLERIKKLPLKMICPQHGSIIKEPLIQDCISALEKFEYGKLIDS